MAILAPNLDRARHAIWARWPGAVVGWIGDSAHMVGCSGHNEDACGLVHAIDPMFAAGTAQANAIVRASVGRPDLEYVIHNRVIYSASYGWKARQYLGSDPHTNHVHVEGKHGSSCANSHTCNGYDKAAEGNTTPWNFDGPPPAPAPVAPAWPGRLFLVTSPLMHGADVRTWQAKMAARGWAITADGWYGPASQAVCRAFQAEKHLGVDGIVGPTTWRATWSAPVT